ncbi:MAG TPA: hypothetical protein VF608_02115 [Thermoanaerobaculia bacterium]
MQVAVTFVLLLFGADTRDAIALQRGITFVAEIHQTEANQVRTVELLQRHSRTLEDVLRTVKLEPSEDLMRVARFDAVPPGEYIVRAGGDEPSQRAGVEVDVGDYAIPPVQLQITPFTLTMRADLEGRGQVLLLNHDGFFETRALLSRLAATSLPMWQGGRLIATVTVAGHVPFRVRRTIDATDSEWTLQMPDLHVEGMVIDAASGAPIENAELALEMTGSDARALGSTTTAHTERFDSSPCSPANISSARQRTDIRLWTRRTRSKRRIRRSR